MGCAEADWLRSLPGAVGGHPLQVRAGAATVAVGPGHLHLDWAVLPPRQIALMRLPRLAVTFVFEQVAPDERYRFMRHFDLHMQRGGG